MHFKVGDKVCQKGSGEYMEIIQIDSLTHPLPQYMVKDNLGAFWDYGFNWEKKVSSEDVLRYGECLTDDQIYALVWTRIRTIRYEDTIYYHKMVDGEVVEMKELI